MSAPRWEPLDDETASLLSLVADPTRPVGRDAVDAYAHGGEVSVNRVRARLVDADIPARRYSSLWAAFTGEGKPMHRTGAWETCSGSTSGNDGRPYPKRRWVGAP